MELADLRLEYKLAALSEADVSRDPFEQFRRWFDQALAAGMVEPNAMTLATAGPDGTPGARIVLLKGFDARGFAFYTNYESRKAQELAANPRAALLFYWAELERQVRLTGVVEKVSREESAEYFGSRPRGSQLGAWASRQSTVVEGRSVLEGELERRTREFGDGPVPLPPFWGGYRLKPDRFEFWQGRPSRLHDRLVYRAGPEGAWLLERLSP